MSEQWPKVLNQGLEEVDPELFDIIEHEKNRQYKVRRHRRRVAPSCLLLLAHPPLLPSSSLGAAPSPPPARWKQRCTPPPNQPPLHPSLDLPYTPPAPRLALTRARLLFPFPPRAWS